MQHEKILTTIVDASLTSRLEVAVCMDAQDGRTMELRRLSWGDGVGWYCQQTLRLGPREANGLFWALKGSRQQWRERSSTGQGKVIPLPLARMNRESKGVTFSGKAPKKRLDNLTPMPSGPEKGRAKPGSKKSSISRA